MTQHLYVRDAKRLKALERTGLLDETLTPRFDRAARVASRVLGTPVNMLAIVGDENQFHVGENERRGPGIASLPIDDSLCRIVVASRRPLVVRDARKDSQVDAYGITPGEGVVAYLGMPVHAPDGEVVGSFCAVDPEPRDWTREQLETLRDLTEMVEAEIALLDAARERDEQAQTFHDIVNELPIGVAVADVPSSRLEWINRWGRTTLDEEIVAENSREYQKLGARHDDGSRYEYDDYPLVRAALYGDVVESEPMTYKRANGSTVELEVSAKRIDTHGLAIATFVDVTDRKRAEGSAAHARAELEHVLEATADPILLIDRFWVVTYVNKAAEEALANGRDLVETDVWESFPDWVDGPIWHAYRDAMRTGVPGKADVTDPRTNTIYEVRAFPAEHELTVFLRDVTIERHLGETRQLLVRELNHRVKNLFAVVTGMVSMTARHAQTPRDMALALRSRIAALAQAHELIQPAVDGENVTQPDVGLRDLVRTLVGPHLQQTSDQMTLDGPAVTLSTNGTTSLSLVVHELATNAAKYGALSVPEGRLSVAWAIEGEELSLTWQERGGPAIGGAPSSRGFGSTLTDLAVTRQLGGRLEADWAPEGVTLTLTVVLDRLTA